MVTNSNFTAGLVVDNPGMLATVQDRGRFGHEAMGITQGGFADGFSARVANRLCGNHLDTACIELLNGGAEFRALRSVTVALTGAAAEVRVNQQPRPLWRSMVLLPGDRLSVAVANAGLRVYLAVAGGFQVTPIMGSCSSVSRDKLGGLNCNGSALKSGDELDVPAIHDGHLTSWPGRHIPLFPSKIEVRVTPAYQHSQFSDPAIKRFFSHDYQVGVHTDRMGMRLQGPAVNWQHGGIVSESISLGAVQVPPDGMPIVMLWDRQTIGGYPKLGSVIGPDCDRLAQCRPGTTLRFVPCDPFTAHNIAVQQRYMIENLDLHRD